MLTFHSPSSNAAHPGRSLEFYRLDLRGSQARHRNRYALASQIRLEDYKCRAVIDFVELEVCTAKHTNITAIRTWIGKELGDPKPYCTNLDARSTPRHVSK